MKEKEHSGSLTEDERKTFTPFEDSRVVSRGRSMVSGYWWDYSYMRSYQGSIKIRGKDYHEVSEEEYYDSLMDET